MYANGKGVTQDYKEAVKWYRLAATQGIALAQYNLGLMYGNGNGVSRDLVRAHMWFNIAAAQGSSDAAQNRIVASKAMTKSQIEEAQEMARKCEGSNYKECD
jgi:TPR repeat protein